VRAARNISSPAFIGSKAGREQAVEFDRILKIVVMLTLLCGGLAVAVAIVAAMMPVPLAGQLVSAFIDNFKVGMAAILGLIGGRGGRFMGR
jgi:hypothetical protein